MSVLQSSLRTWCVCGVRLSWSDCVLCMCVRLRILCVCKGSTDYYSGMRVQWWCETSLYVVFLKLHLFGNLQQLTCTFEVSGQTELNLGIWVFEHNAFEKAGRCCRLLVFFGWVFLNKPSEEMLKVSCLGSLEVCLTFVVS
jgi:hypothetical protein